MTPLYPDTGTNSTAWYLRGAAPGWITLGAAVAFIAVGTFAEEVALPACRLNDTCGSEPIGTLSFGLLAATVVAAFVFARAARPVAVAFLLAFVLARFTEVGHAWWVDATAAGFVAVTLYVTWARHVTLPGLVGNPSSAATMVPVGAARDVKTTLVEPGWLLGCAVTTALAVAGAAGYVIARPGEAASDWLLLLGVAGGIALALGWRAVDRSLKRWRFLRRPQPVRHCTVLPLRFEVLVVSGHPTDPILVVASTVWEEARLGRLWAGAGPDGCAARLYGDPVAARWAAVEIGGQLVVAREPAWTEGRDDALRAAVTLLRHLADAVPNTDVADTIRRTADRYAVEVGEPDNSLPGL